MKIKEVTNFLESYAPLFVFVYSEFIPAYSKFILGGKYSCSGLKVKQLAENQ
jgi:hypothetical protein